MLNGKSLGAKPLPADARPRNWHVAYEPGTLEAIARNRGQEVARRTLRTAGPAHAIVLKSSREKLSPAWDDVAVIEAQIVDEAGNLVPAAANQLSFSAIGAGRVIAVDSGSIVSHELFQTSQRNAFQGRAVAYVRSTAQSGEIQVTDAMIRLMKQQPFWGLKFEGTTYDCGDKLGFLSANVAYGLEREDLGPAFKQALKRIIASHGGLD